MEYNTKWSKAHSESFRVLCGTKQGGILSPDFFSIYINDLIIILKNMGIGCHIIREFIACILFADDMTLISPTRSSLQRLLNACAEYCSKYSLKFNIGKTQVMVFGNLSLSLSTIATISLQDVTIQYVKLCKYLGFYIKSGRNLSFSLNKDLRGFFGRVNSVLSSTSRPKENVLMQLLYSNCVPKLTYGAAVKDYNASEKHQLNVAVNNAIRRIFGFRLWQSIRQIREYYGFDAIEMMIAKAQRKFMGSLRYHDNRILRLLSTLDS